ncbi:MAG TPA: signal peptidase I [Thermoanaerobaculia bacterium]|nr:signal peptidase I [Thermoanaerobaculia bacterium]
MTTVDQDRPDSARPQAAAGQEPGGPSPGPGGAPGLAEEDERRRSGLRDYLEALLIAVIFATFARTYVVQAFKIPSGSMEENLLVGDHILVNKFLYGPTASEWERRLLPVRDVRRGDVVVFRFPDDPERDFIKRCVGLPGDVVELVDKRLFINGAEVDDDSYTVHRDERVFPRSPFIDEGRRNRDNYGPYRVPEDGFFCLGDNRDNSRDSRAWRHTAVPREFVKGRALLIYWSVEMPPERLAVAGRQPPGERLRTLGDRLLALPGRTRWERSFDLVR